MEVGFALHFSVDFLMMILTRITMRQGISMAHTKETFAKKIVTLTKEHWDKTKTPLLLSQLGTSLKESGFDYKEILKEQSLVAFISSDVTELTIAKHPTQYAKVGIHSTINDFSYPDTPTTTKPKQSEADKLRKSRRAFYGFIEAISELPQEEIEGVSIPARVIVLLLEGK